MAYKKLQLFNLLGQNERRGEKKKVLILQFIVSKKETCKDSPMKSWNLKFDFWDLRKQIETSNEVKKNT